MGQAVNSSAGSVFEVILDESVVCQIGEVLSNTEGLEACGFLLGAVRGHSTFIDRARPAENIYRDMTSFAISPEGYTSALQSPDHDRSIVGIYHTHDGPAHLSGSDRRNMALHPYFWLIIGGAGGPRTGIRSWRCFRSIYGKVRELHLRIGS